MKLTPQLRTIERLHHIIEAIGFIEQFTKDGLRSDDQMQISALYYQLLVVGEACKHIDESYTQHFSDIPWKRIIATRNYLVHEYFAVHADKIEAALNDIPRIKTRLIELLDSLEHANR